MAVTEKEQHADAPAVDRVQFRSHRGLGPENTLLAYREAVKAPYTDALELDLRQTRDGHIIGMHDPTVDRTTDGTGAVTTLTYDEVQDLTVGKTADVPAFIDILDLLRDARHPETEGAIDSVWMELKEDIGSEVLTRLRAYEDTYNTDIESDVIFSAFNPDRFVEGMETRALLVHDPYDTAAFDEYGLAGQDAFDVADAYDCDIIAAYYDQVDESFVEDAQAAGYQAAIIGITSWNEALDAAAMEPEYVSIEQAKPETLDLQNPEQYMAPADT
jgi:glycerophosphoryl diester phosphodiesterase